MTKKRDNCGPTANSIDRPVMANVQRGLPAGPGGVQVPGGPGAPGVAPQPPGAVQVGPAAQAMVSRPGGPAGIIQGAVTTQK